MQGFEIGLIMRTTTNNVMSIHLTVLLYSTHIVVHRDSHIQVYNQATLPYECIKNSRNQIIDLLRILLVFNKNI